MNYSFFNMENQSYQEVTLEVQKELPLIKKDVQLYFFKLKDKYPKRFERLMFDDNGHKPYSKDLNDILFDLKFSNINIPNITCAGGRINPTTGKKIKYKK